MNGECGASRQLYSLTLSAGPSNWQRPIRSLRALRDKRKALDHERDMQEAVTLVTWAWHSRKKAESSAGRQTCLQPFFVRESSRTEGRKKYQSYRSIPTEAATRILQRDEADTKAARDILSKVFDGERGDFTALAGRIAQTEFISQAHALEWIDSLLQGVATVAAESGESVAGTVVGTEDEAVYKPDTGMWPAER
jgi:hypothetical protein